LLERDMEAGESMAVWLGSEIQPPSMLMWPWESILRP